MDSGTRRKNATRETTSTLKAWLQEHRKNPYPTKGARGAGTLIPSAQRLVWAAKQPLGNAALGALFA